jgi:hypothetical protein
VPLALLAPPHRDPSPSQIAPEDGMRSSSVFNRLLQHYRQERINCLRGLQSGNRGNDLFRAGNHVGVVRDIDIEGGMHLLI